MNKKKSLVGLLTFLCLPLFSQTTKNEALSDLALQVEQSLAKGLAFMQTLAIEGGYVYHYSLDGKERWGEGKTDGRTIEVQPPGTPAVGMSFLRAYRLTKSPSFLMAANVAANALIRGQNKLGGWEHKIYFDRPKGHKVSFDDNQTQSAISFLMAMDEFVDEPSLTTAIERALDMMLDSQLDNGGWPHQYPRQGNYHDFATFNDQGINDCIRVMIEANHRYNRAAYRESLDKVGRFLMISQLPPPQPGWAQQYNEFLQPAWARSFEPPAVCPSASIHNLNSLMDLYLHTGSSSYLEPIPDALRWLKASELPNGKWGRFLELGTNKALYYDRGRIRVDSLHQLSLERRTGYAYEVNLKEALAKVEDRFINIQKSSQDLNIPINAAQLQRLAEQASLIISKQDKQGRWIIKNDKFRRQVKGKGWNGEYRIEDRISTRLFNDNVNVLCSFLEAFQQSQN